MNLDDLDRFKKLDTLNMLSEIDGLPDQLHSAWELGKTMLLPEARDIRCVVIAGMGGSAIGADLVAGFVSAVCAAPVLVHRDYGLPAFAHGKETLFVACSHSGNTEETLDAFASGLKNHCTMVVICKGGELAARARENGIPVWSFTHSGQPRAAVGFSFGLLLALFSRLNLIPDPAKELTDAVETMKKSQEHLRVEIPTALNPAKRYAGQLMGRWVTVFGAGILAPVARRMKTQLNEVAKAAANFEFLPEADHNTLQGLIFPADVLNAHTMTLFLRAPSENPHNRRRIELTRQVYMLEGLNTDFIDASGSTLLDHVWTSVLFGDYLAYYLAIALGINPTPIPTLEDFKVTLRGS